MQPGFSAEAIKFLRGIKRNNNREWFLERKQVFETELKEPMIRLVEDINGALLKFAPEYVTEPKKAVFRFYRDTRFSKDKTPYKTHVAAWFKRSGFNDKSAAGFYFHVGADEVVIAGGLYMPPPDQLLAVRTHLLDHHERFRQFGKAKKIKSLFDGFGGDSLTRDPKGFPKDHPAGDLIRMKQWGFGSTLPGALATTPKLYSELIKRFEALTPIVNFLNEPFAHRRPRREIYFE